MIVQEKGRDVYMAIILRMIEIKQNMMKEINTVNYLNLIEIKFEPGDCTHYHFYLFKESEDDYVIIPGRSSTFIFPQRMNKYEAKSIVAVWNEVDFNIGEAEIINSFVAKYNCNYYTVLAVATIINEISK
jgi:hypothetical protein